MKKLFALISFVIFANFSFSQSIPPPLQTRTTGEFYTSLDQRLAAGKNLYLPQVTTPGLNGGLLRAGHIEYNISDNTVYVYNGVTHDPLMKSFRKVDLASPSGEQYAIVNDPAGAMFGQGFLNSSGMFATGMIQIYGPFKDHMVSIEGTIYRYTNGSNEPIKFKISGYPYSSAITWDAFDAIWERTGIDLSDVKVTAGKITVGSVTYPAITIGTTTTQWGRYFTFNIDKVYLTNDFIPDNITSGWKAELVTSSAFIPSSVSAFVNLPFKTVELQSNKSTATSLGTSDLLYPSQKAVKTYVDSVTANSTATGKWKVILIAGQSNAVGCNSNDAIYPVDQLIQWSHSRIYQYSFDGGSPVFLRDETGNVIYDGGNRVTDGVDYSKYTQKLIPAIEPLKWHKFNDVLNFSNLYGANGGMSFARKLLQYISGGDNIIIIPAAVPGTGLVGSSWSYPSGQLAQDAITTATNVINSLPNAELADIIWGQGENESQNNTSPSTYRTEMDNTLMALRTQIPNASNANIFIHAMPPDWVADNTATGAAGIDSVQRTTPLRLSRCFYIQGDKGYLFDAIHYNAAFHEILGKRDVEKSQSIALLTNGSTLGIPTGLTALGTKLSWTVPSSDAALFFIDYRNSGSTGPFTRITYSPKVYYKAGSTVSYVFANLTQDIEVKVACAYYNIIGTFSSSITVPYLTIPTPFSRMDMDNLTNTGSLVNSVPSTGTNTTAWVPPSGKNPLVLSFNGKRILGTDISNSFLIGPTLPIGSYTKMVLVRHNFFNAAGTYLSTQDNFTNHLFWRGGDGVTAVAAGHNGSGGDAVSSNILVQNEWCVLTITYNSTNGQIKIYKNVTLVASGTTSNWSTSTPMVFNTLSESASSNGNSAAFREVKVWTTALSQAQISQEVVIMGDSLDVPLN